MARMFQTIPNLLGGVSQQPHTVRAPNEVTRMDNALLSTTDGIRKRPPTQHIATIDPDISDVPDRPFIHTVKRGSTDLYTIAVMNGELFVYDSLTGEQKQVITPNGMGYLLSVNGIRAATIGDTTVLVNRDVVVGKKAGRSAAAINEALLYIKTAQYDNTYKVDLGGGFFASYTTATLGDDNASRTLATEEVAIGLYGALLNNKFFQMYFNATFYGSSILVTRKDNQEFALKVSDSAGGGGLVLIQGQVQRFDSLPPRARPGMVVKVSGDPLSGKDDYWVEYQESNTLRSPGTGLWREIPAPGASEGLDKSTMPWAVTRYGSLIGTRRVLKDSLAPTIEFTGSSQFSYGFNSLDPTTGVLLTDNNQMTEVFALPSGTYSSGGVILVGLDIDNSGAKRDEEVYVELQADYGSGWTAQDGITLVGGERLRDIQLRTKYLSFAPGHKFRIEIYTDVSPSVKPRVYVHPGTHPEIPGLRLIHEPHYRVEYPSGALYYGDHSESLRVALFTPDLELDENYLVTNVIPGTGVTMSSVEMAIEQELQVNALAAANPVNGIMAVQTGNILRIYLTANNTKPVWTRTLIGGFFYVMREFTNGTEICLLDDADGWATDSLVGKLVNNITDGSSGTISSNTGSSLTVASLSGGVRNAFEPGDLVEVVADEDEYFVFDQLPWTDRLAGSDESCPLPSFVGKQLSEVFFYKNRLGLCSGELINMSASGDLFRFMRRTATDLLDDDPIDITSSHQDIAEFGAAVLWKQKLYLFSTAGHQFVLSGEPNLTPKTVSLEHIGSHPCSLDTRPMTVGDQLFFIRNTGAYARVMEMVLDINGMAFARDLTKKVPQFIIGSVIDMCGDQNVGSLFFLTDWAFGRNILYVYNYEKDANGQDQMGAWHKWTFDPTYQEPTATKPKILTIDMVDGYLYTAMTRKGHPTYGYEGVMLEKINLSSPTDNRHIHWDRVGIPNIAAPYNMWIELSTIFPRDDNGAAITDGILKLQYVNVKYHKVGLINVTAQKDTTQSTVKTVFFPGATGGIEGNIRLPIMGTNTRVTISITCEHHQGCGLTTVSWEGDYHRSRG